MLTELKTFVFGALLLLPLAGLAQSPDSVVRLKEVVIEQSRLGSYAISKYTVRIDSLTRQLAGGSSLADMLRKYGYGHMRSYGPGGLSTPSFRGTGSSHTAVLWNGINLVSPLNGQLDLSHIPVSFIDDASVQTGGTASLYGNGSIGATIQLNNKAKFGEGLRMSAFTNAGSFGTFFQDLGVSWSGKKFISSTKIFTSKAENDFEYINNNYYPAVKERRDHSAMRQKGILQQNYWQVAPAHLLTLKLWYQDDHYEVPNPISVSKKSEALEQNTFYRAVAGWHFNHKNFELNYQGAFVRQDLHYADSTTNLQSTNNFDTFMNTLETNFSPSANTTMTAGLNYTWEKAFVDGFGTDEPERNRVAMFSAIKWTPATKWEFSLAAREEFVNGNANPFAPSLTAKLKATRKLNLFTSMARNYRIPTFNDLYWKGAGGLGNPNLKSELSLTNELGLNFSSDENLSGFQFSFKAALFSSSVDNWILWIPVGSATFTPQNIKKVWSRGVETQGSVRTKVGRLVLQLSGLYTFTRSTNEALYENGNPNELHKQLLLTPEHEGSATGRVEWRGFTVNIVTSYTGRQYTDSDNDPYNAMKAYSVTSLWMSKTLSAGKSKASIIGEVNNVFDSPYQSRPGYPMPGINYKLGLNIQFHKPNSI